jgi:AraC family ethanolamine operon transcriptional activator
MRLLCGDAAESVTIAAHACGFTHLGRFSVAYGRTFGEPPSATRAAALRQMRVRSE